MSIVTIQIVYGNERAATEYGISLADVAECCAWYIGKGEYPTNPLFTPDDSA
jgi:hypothetical protein